MLWSPPQSTESDLPIATVGREARETRGPREDRMQPPNRIGRQDEGTHKPRMVKTAEVLDVRGWDASCATNVKTSVPTIVYTSGSTVISMLKFLHRNRVIEGLGKKRGRGRWGWMCAGRIETEKREQQTVERHRKMSQWRGIRFHSPTREAVWR